MNILIICTGNTCRSPLAAAYLNSITREDTKVESAGLMAVERLPASENSIKVADKENIDLSSHKSKQVDQQLIDNADLILTMTEGHKRNLLALFPQSEGKVYTLTEHSLKNSKDDKAAQNGDICDPFGQSLAQYERCFRQIKQHLKHLSK
ncbi:low molecular weight protein arginine phosphatase [Proteinivorax hydrogeniformans]|uniref:Low molecular weight protein arginine phosphatase n=1 Tax=Proteinivorax hydrogeniformans TaxID=1826727 RepID=A0AAU8HTQ7_9FIRM